MAVNIGNVPATAFGVDLGASAITVTSGKLSTTNTEFVIEETGNGNGTSRMHVGGAGAVAGFILENAGLDLVDLQLLGSAHNMTVRMEGRGGGSSYSGSTPELQLGNAAVVIAPSTGFLFIKTNILVGPNSAAGNLNLGSTSNATKGLVRIGNNTGTAVLTVVDGGTNGQALVGINNESPGGQLDVKSTGNCSQLITAGGSGSQAAIVMANPTNGMDIRVRSTAGTLSGVANAGGQVVYNGGIGPFVMGTGTAFDLNLVVNSTAVLTVASGASGNATLTSTANAAKGQVQIGGTTGLVYDETNKRLGVGVSPTSTLHLSAANAEALFKSTSSSSTADLQLQNSGSTANIILSSYGSAVAGTVYGVNFASACGLFSSAGTAPLIIGTLVASDIVFGTTSAATAERMRVDASGNVSVGAAALATTATDGFLYLTTCAGTPTGVPTAKTGRAPVVYDSTANKIWVYNGSWRGVAVT